MSGYDSDDPLESINEYENKNTDTVEDENHIEEVRKAVSEWKTKGLNQNVENTVKANGLEPLRAYVADTAQLYYDLNSYLKTSENEESNMKNTNYVKIITAIGSPASLSNHLMIVLQHLLKRDLIELPFTVDSKVVNSYAKKGQAVNTDFPDEE